MSTIHSPESKERPLSRERIRSGVSPLTIKLIFAVRAVYLCELLIFVQRRDRANLLFYGAIFVGSLVIPLLGRLDREYYRLDVFAMSIFAMGPLFTSFQFWPEPTDIQTLLFGKDKPLHIAGGACLAMFAAISLRRYVSSSPVYYVLIVVVALALGAAWEIFEWLTSILPRPFRLQSAGYADTMIDMVADVIGASMAAVALRLRSYHQLSAGVRE
jgi:uncharacterized membrane protein YjdF